MGDYIRGRRNNAISSGNGAREEGTAEHKRKRDKDASVEETTPHTQER